MIHIHTIADYSRFGLIFLTGESCKYGLRLLFDYTTQGKRVLEEASGITIEGAGAWNDDVATVDPQDRQAHIGSILLAQSQLPVLAIFGLRELHCIEVIELRDGSFVGTQHGDEPETVDYYKKQLRRPKEQNRIRISSIYRAASTGSASLEDGFCHLGEPSPWHA